MCSSSSESSILIKQEFQEFPCNLWVISAAMIDTPQETPWLCPIFLWVFIYSHKKCILRCNLFCIVGSVSCTQACCMQTCIKCLNLSVCLLCSQMCSACRDPGATLGCFFKGCPNKYHYRCALESGECSCLPCLHTSQGIKCPAHVYSRAATDYFHYWSICRLFSRLIDQSFIPWNVKKVWKRLISIALSPAWSI